MTNLLLRKMNLKSKEKIFMSQMCSAYKIGSIEDFMLNVQFAMAIKSYFKGSKKGSQKSLHT